MPLPKWVLPAAIGALGGLLGRRGIRGRPGGIERMPILAPEQQRILARLTPFVEERIGRGLPAWEGPWIAPPSPEEEIGLGRLGEYLRAGIPEITEFGLGRFREALAGLTPEETEAWWRAYRQPMWQRMWEEEIVPGLREARVAPGTLYGTPYVTDVERMMGRWAEAQQAELGRAIMEEREAARAMLPYVPEMAALVEEAPLRRARAAMELGALPRLLRQAEIAAQFEEFRRTTPELSPVLDLAMNLLRLQTQAAFYRPYRPSPLVEILGAIAPGVGAYLGGLATDGVSRLASEIAGQIGPALSRRTRDPLRPITRHEIEAILRGE